MSDTPKTIDVIKFLNFFVSQSKQTGAGHFSPIGGYHAGRDMALILDVARFKYPPHWVPLTLLWEAMDTLVGATGLHRGFMLISRLRRAPSLLYNLSCKQESWASIAKYLVDDVPALLSSEDVKEIKDVFSVVLMSLPSNFGEFIKWVAEVRRKEDDDPSLSQEGKERIAIKEELLKQVRKTGLFKHVTDCLLSERSCCKTIPTVGNEDSLPDIAASVCCQGACFLSGNPGSSDLFCCQEARVKCLKDNGEKPVTVVSRMVINSSGEQGVDVLVPSSETKWSCCRSSSSSFLGMHPTRNDVLTALLLALPPQTWSGIKEEKLLKEILDLVSTENLPALLLEEILHLRAQLHLLKRCRDNKVMHHGSQGVSQRSKSFREAKVVFKRSNFCSKRKCDIRNTMTDFSKMPLLARENAVYQGIGGLVKEYVKPARIWGGSRFLSTCPKTAQYGLRFSAYSFNSLNSCLPAVVGAFCNSSC